MTWQSINYFSEHGAPSHSSIATCEGAVSALIDVQRQLKIAIESISDDDYREQLMGAATGRIGGHVRHCLDHVSSLLAAVRTGRLDYDDRQRGTDLEYCRAVALETIGQQESLLSELKSHSLDRILRLKAIVHHQMTPVETFTTLGRELASVLSHTVHHSSLIGIMIRMLGHETPHYFGYAPATIAFREATACAQ